MTNDSRQPKPHKPSRHHAHHSECVQCLSDCIHNLTPVEVSHFFEITLQVFDGGRVLGRSLLREFATLVLQVPGLADVPTENDDMDSHINKIKQESMKRGRTVSGLPVCTLYSSCSHTVRAVLLQVPRTRFLSRNISYARFVHFARGPAYRDARSSSSAPPRQNRKQPYASSRSISLFDCHTWLPSVINTMSLLERCHLIAHIHDLSRHELPPPRPVLERYQDVYASAQSFQCHTFQPSEHTHESFSAGSSSISSLDTMSCCTCHTAPTDTGFVFSYLSYIECLTISLLASQLLFLAMCIQSPIIIHVVTISMMTTREVVCHIHMVFLIVLPTT